MALSGHIVGLLKEYMHDLVIQAEQEAAAHEAFGFSETSYHPDQAISDLLANSGALIVVGSSLAVMSSYRILLEADRARKPIGIVNLGPTRGEERATFRWRTGVKPALEWLDQAMS